MAVRGFLPLQSNFSGMRLYFCLILSVILAGFSSCKKTGQQQPENKPLNIIVMIGDGMGLSQISSLYYAGNDTPSFTFFPVVGLINTSSASHKITDSGAGGTAFSIGERTYNGAIGVGTDSLPRKNLVEILSEKAYLTGLVATSSITHATPAAFYAHVRNRSMEEEIALQLIHSDIDFFAGSGIKFFNQRNDRINLFDTFPKYGFLVDTQSLKANIQYDINKKYGFLLYARSMPKATEKRGDFLPNATKAAIKYLSASEHGFFLMVEGSQIDWAGHDNDADYLIAEILDFNKAIKVALDFAEKDGNTLVVVLADHETGGFSLPSSAGYEDEESDYNSIKPTFSSKGHTASLIPVFAFGKGAENFGGIYQNKDIFYKILQSAGLK